MTKAGDIIGFAGHSWVSALVNVATYGVPLWSLSHVGIIGRTNDGRLLLFESTEWKGMPCAISGQVLRGVQAHALEDVVAAYRGKVWHYPVCRELYPDEDSRLTSFLMSLVGTPYDQIGAIRSAGIGLSFVESLLRPEALDSIYCSELVAAAYQHVGLSRTDNVSRWSPARLVRRLRWHGILREPRRLK